MKTYIGIDVSKLHLDFHHLKESGQIPNTEKAIARWLKSLPADAFLVCESSGGYESLLITLAHAAGRPIARINARQVRDFAGAKGRLAKTDKIDAKLLVDFAATFHPDPMALPDRLQEELSALVKHRTHLLRQITQNNNLACRQGQAENLEKHILSDWRCQGNLPGASHFNFDLRTRGIGQFCSRKLPTA